MSTSEDPTSIPCVTIHGGKQRYSATTVPPTHPIFQNAPVPISRAFGYPLLMHRVAQNLARGPATDNQHATWLNIDPVSGFAPDAWQGAIGDVIVAKPDKTALSVGELGGIVDYVAKILDRFGDARAAPTDLYDRSRLDAFVRPALGAQAEYQRQLLAWRASHAGA